jgi:solute carrier family 35 protein F5
LATQWCVVWFIANWAVNASLGWTSVASVTILSSTAGAQHIEPRDLQETGC